MLIFTVSINNIMTIDITPTLEVANDLDAQCIKMREIDALYVIRLRNGEDYTTKFDLKSLDEFQPNKKVSEMMASWRDNILRRIKIYTKALKYNQHPTQKKLVDTGRTLKRYGETIPVMEYGDEPEELDDYDRKAFKKFIHDLTEEKGSMELVKIIVG